MRDLERTTGVSRDTVRFWIREGLLPEPERTGRNAAWYPRAFVERIAFIRELQRKRFLPLAVIRAIVRADDAPPAAEVDTLLQLDGRLFPAVAGRPATPPERLRRVARRLGLPVAEVRTLAAVGAVTTEARDGDVWLDAAGQRVAACWARLRAAGYARRLGFGPERLALYVHVVRWLAREELHLFTAGVTGRVPTDRAARMAEDGIELVNGLLTELRRATLLRLIAEGNLPAPDARVATAVSSGRRIG
jgi:DNA-binding transcriptional MerR regulator